MRGHLEIIAMRMNRSKPAAVILTDTPACLPNVGGVLIEPKDMARTADMRFLVDCKVEMHFRDEARMDDFAEAAFKARAHWVRTSRLVLGQWPERRRIEWREVRQDGSVIVDGVRQ